jgi:hypothetical protein
MNYIKEFKEFNPVLDLKVKEYVEDNKYNIPELWDNNISEEENVQFMLKYFSEYPNEMSHSINLDNVKKASQKSNSLDYAPKLTNIGGVNKRFGPS